MTQPIISLNQSFSAGPTVEKLDLENLTKWLQFGWEIIYKK